MALSATATEGHFRQQFARVRLASDLNFLVLHTIVTMLYIKEVPSPLAKAVALGGAFVPLALRLCLPTQQLVPARTPIVLMVRLSIMYVSAQEFLTDTSATGQALSTLAFPFKLLLSARVFVYLCVALGLQLPLPLDLPLQLCGVASVVATAIPRQCGLSWPVAGPQPPSSLLFLLNHRAFELIADVLDWPFMPFVARPGEHSLSGRPLCVSVYTWVLLVISLGVPTTALWVAESRERSRFFKARQEQGQQAQQAQQGQGQGGQGTGSAGAVGGSHLTDDGSPPAWVYFACVAQMFWCGLRTLFKLVLN